MTLLKKFFFFFPFVQALPKHLPQQQHPRQSGRRLPRRRAEQVHQDERVRQPDHVHQLRPRRRRAGDAVRGAEARAPHAVEAGVGSGAAVQLQQSFAAALAVMG